MHHTNHSWGYFFAVKFQAQLIGSLCMAFCITQLVTDHRIFCQHLLHIFTNLVQRWSVLGVPTSYVCFRMVLRLHAEIVSSKHTFATGLIDFQVVDMHTNWQPSVSILGCQLVCIWPRTIPRVFVLTICSIVIPFALEEVFSWNQVLSVNATWIFSSRSAGREFRLGPDAWDHTRYLILHAYTLFELLYSIIWGSAALISCGTDHGRLNCWFVL